MNASSADPKSGVADDFLQAIEIATDHPAFAGHFPGRPIVPGVVLLDQILLTITPWHAAASPGKPTRCEIANAKFLSPVTPGESLQLHAMRQTGDRADTIRFELSCGARKIASGMIKLHHEPTP
jgi:3-hydroxymyristoyl/3-hydroxydecanoyl-(acyl carrier protein) dehydratase